MSGNKFQSWNNKQIASHLQDNYVCLNELKEILDFLFKQLEKANTASEKYDIHLEIFRIKRRISEFSIVYKELKSLLIIG